MNTRMIENKAKSVDYPFEWYGIAAIDYDRAEERGDIGIYRIGKFDNSSEALDAMFKFACCFMGDSCEIAFVSKDDAAHFARKHGFANDAEEVAAAEGKLEYVLHLGYIEVDMYDLSLS